MHLKTKHFTVYLIIVSRVCLPIHSCYIITQKEAGTWGTVQAPSKNPPLWIYAVEEEKNRERKEMEKGCQKYFRWDGAYLRSQRWLTGLKDYEPTFGSSFKANQMCQKFYLGNYGGNHIPENLIMVVLKDLGHLIQLEGPGISGCEKQIRQQNNQSCWMQRSPFQRLGVPQ